MCVFTQWHEVFFTLAIQLLLLPHASFYLRTTIFQDKNNGFLECKKLQEAVIRKGAWGQKVQLLELLLLPPSLRMHWLLEGAEPFQFPVIFASDKAVISDLIFQWEQIVTSLTLASLAGWG